MTPVIPLHISTVGTESLLTLSEQGAVSTSLSLSSSPSLSYSLSFTSVVLFVCESISLRSRKCLCCQSFILRWRQQPTETLREREDERGERGEGGGLSLPALPPSISASKNRLGQFFCTATQTSTLGQVLPGKTSSAEIQINQNDRSSKPWKE